MAGKILNCYWDACVWITLITDSGTSNHDSCLYVLEMAQRGECRIWTSTFTLAEVFKRKCDMEMVGLAEGYDEKFEDLIEQDFVMKIQVDMDVGTVARRLLRKFPKIGKPQDAIHVASALLENIDELHTFDREDLLSMSGQLERADKVKLIIKPPPERPIPPQIEMTV